MNCVFDISIIIPTKDEESNFSQFLTAVVNHCLKSSLRYEIIVINDANSVTISQIALNSTKTFPNLKLITLPVYRGKGFSIKRGFFSAQGNIVLSLETNGSIHPEEIEKHLPLFDQGFDIVSDTQGSFKMFRRCHVGPLFGRVYLNDTGFDLETLHLAKKIGYKIKETLINHQVITKNKPTSLANSLQQLINIFQIRSWHYTHINLSNKHMSVTELKNMYAQEKNHWWFQSKNIFIRRLMQLYINKNQFILDAGCGTGHNMSFLKNKSLYVGCDISFEALSFCRQNGLNNLIQASTEGLPFQNNAFDLVLSLDVAEHTEDPDSVVKDLHRVLKNDGQLLLTVPAFRFLWSPHDESLSHLRRYNKKDVYRLLEDNGFNITHCGYLFAGPFIPVALIRLIRKLFVKDPDPKCDTYYSPSPIINRIMNALSSVEVWLLGRVPLPFGTSLYAVATKKKD